ncbi:Ada metal-binding domain-containing protein [Geobacter sp. DSM 9736]|uniref:Ada metal-binding domain-containing protein n=1 Tax=Geobacter sp. DSM 9736 TaxID=1277350 RepID=UPI000B50FFAF|nr:Ada metal-binding domain-containing protein [Geobacter sp. DSM 9736]SNB46747.1 Metal binding domain of Ada [Geobacter sp. DSM 9736]
MKKLLLPLILLLLLPAVALAEFYGSTGSNKYHFKECRWTKRIAKENLVTFRASVEAGKAGYVPCETCKPPMPERRPALPDSKEKKGN